METTEDTIKGNLLLSTDVLSGFGLDLIFDTAKNAWFDGLDLALWKNFDAWNVSYVKKLSDTHNFPVKIIQTSDSLNKKEMEKALDLCEALNVDTININAPKFFDYRAFNFIKDNIESYKKANKDISFSIVNPIDTSFFAVPIPKYRFNNISEIVKKYWCDLAFDIAWLDEHTLEDNFMRRVEDFLPYMSTVYLSDKNKEGKSHLLPGDGILKLPTLLKIMKKNNYNRYFSLKVDISKWDLVDAEKLDLIFKKVIRYFQENYLEAKID